MPRWNGSAENSVPMTWDSGEEELRAALPDTEPPVLLMSYVQLTGDTAFMEQFRPHIRKVRDFADDIPPPLIAELHERMVGLLCNIRERVPSLTRDVLTRMMSLCVGEPVPEQYMPMLLSELGVERNDAPAEFGETPAASGFPRDFRVAVIGAGLSGICAAAHLRRAGISFTVFEKNEAVGGTWWENQYPGCGVDTMNHWYSYSFAMKSDWTRYFVQRRELQDYLQQCVRDFDLEPDIRLGATVIRATWNEKQAEWTLALTDSEGRRQEAPFNAVICAVGQLNNPAIPRVEGLDSFSGKAFHSARWPAGLDVTGKRVAMIGTGATGTQIAPAIVDKVAALDIYQRSAHWVTGRANYTKRVAAGKQWALKNIPFYARWYRFQILWAYGDGLYKALERARPWDDPQRSVSPASEEVREIWESYLEEALADRPDLLEKSRPRYPPYGKRPLFDNNWFATLKRPHVALIQDPIERAVPEGLVTAGGELHPADVIVFATGFQASRMVCSLDVQGVDGQMLSEAWEQENPRAYLGSTVPGFPNFFLLYGPNTNLAHGGSIAFIAERQTEYALRCLAELKRRGAPAMQVTPQAYERYSDEVDAQHANLVWSVEGFDTWYRNGSGRVTMNSPWTLLKYWQLTRRVDPADYSFVASAVEAGT